MSSKKIYFTLSRRPPKGSAGLGDTLSSLDAVRSFMLQLPFSVSYVFKPFKFAHIDEKHWEDFYKYFGLSFHYTPISDRSLSHCDIISFDLYKHLSDFLQSDKGDFNEFFQEIFGCYNNVILDIIYTPKICSLIDKILSRANLAPRSNFTHYDSYFNEEAVLYREQLPHKSLFPAEAKIKVFANYRMAEYAVLKLNNSLWYDYITRNFYNSLSELKKERESILDLKGNSIFPVVTPDFFLPIFKSYLKEHPNAYILLTTDGYIEHPKLLDYFNKDKIKLSNFLDKSLARTFQCLKPYCSQIYVGTANKSSVVCKREPSRLFILLNSLFDSDIVLKCVPQLSGFTNLKARCMQKNYDLLEMPYLWGGDSIYLTN